MLSVKVGVRYMGLCTEALLGLVIANSVFSDHGLDCIITDLCGPSHGRKSAHFTGRAFDLRSKHIPDDTMKERVFVDLQEALGPDWDVLFEDRGGNNEHFHCEWDPKTG